MTIICKDCRGYNNCGDPASNNDGNCSGYQPITMIEKYKDKMDIGVWLKIKEYIEDLESQLRSCSKAYTILKMEVDKIENMTFSEKWKFLFGGK
uniref:Uncharacterized protein n=1 Tax=viral metagenome TaxID=1070528 RepID=A0A6H2A3Z1_9ZZZZ